MSEDMSKALALAATATLTGIVTIAGMLVQLVYPTRIMAGVQLLALVAFITTCYYTGLTRRGATDTPHREPPATSPPAPDDISRN